MIKLFERTREMKFVIETISLFRIVNRLGGGGMGVATYTTGRQK
jgi:hypothetical protein